MFKLALFRRPNVSLLIDKGYLSIEEFKAIIKEIEPELPETELNDVVEEVDADGSGRIEFEEFLGVMAGE